MRERQRMAGIASSRHTRIAVRIGISNAVFPPHGPAAQGTWGLRGSVRSRQRPASAVHKPLRQSIGEVVYG